MNKPKEEHFIKLKELISKIKDKDSWLNAVIADGKRKGSYEENWRKLINQIKETCFIAEKLNGLRFGKTIDIKKDNFVEYKESYEKLKNNNGKVGFFTCFFDKKIKEAIGTVFIDGHPPQSVEDYDLILYEISLRESRKKCASYWNELVFKNTGPNFETFNSNGQPEIIAEKYIKDIEFCLKWYEKEFEEINREIISAGIDKEVLFDINYEITLKEEIRIILDSLKTKAIYMCEIVLLFLKQINNYSIINNIKVLLTQGKRSKSKYCNNIIKALNNYNVGSYEFDYNNLVVTYKKQNVIITRNKLLNKLIPVAPDLSKQIDKKIGIHGKGSIPDNFFDAWKWKVLSKELEKIKSESLETLLVKNLDLSKEYRKATAIFAEKSAWYYLLKNTEYDRDMRQALQGWKQTVKKIGKGTGKNAAKYREEARNLMAKCQKAVPAWIMPMNKVIENLDPRINQFDYIIIDEASQADISSLAVLYMGKKLIIVGDDKQVSPLSIGTKTDKINSYEEMYLKDKIPNAHLYNEKTSIYDIASTTFQPLMLREHFRCVPEIIGYSNMLSYDYKIKPLRDGSFSKLIPAVINYRVENGERDGFKTNSKEAQTIVSLIQACMEQPEYKDKTFGVISLLGDEQYKMIQAIIYKNIEQKDISERKILCGNASHFQGDERDVIFLSLVDSRNEEGGPLRKIEFGNDDCIRKRYNVAASRAKDQLWVVHSLDVNNDLKSGDIRKNLIKYAINPKSFENKQEEIKSKSDSEFERLVVSDLDVRGYHLKQQWKVGAYSIDIVAICGENKIAIECDGERWHSGEAKIREDMERQTILERIGWRFIRIRGSEYFRYPDKTINRVVKELNDFGIFPEELNTIKTDEARTSDLLHRVKIRASEILLGFQNTNDSDSAY